MIKTNRLGVLLACITMTGCASSNYDFSLVDKGPSRTRQLADDLHHLSIVSDGNENELHKLSVVPLVHSHLHVFARSDEAVAPAGYVEAEIDSALPLFGFVNGSVSHYNEQLKPITRHQFDSIFWGAFRKNREFIVTRDGLRETVRHTVLWIFSWNGSETWHTAELNWDQQAITARQ